jgi:polysaccharide biosynthesis protein PslH
MWAIVRLLLIVPFGPRLDSPHGGRVVAQLLEHLTARHEVALIALIEAGSPGVDPELAARCALVHEIPTAPHRLLGPAWRHRQRVLTMPLTHRPARVAVAHSRRLIPVARSIAREWRPDVIQIEDDSLAYCAPALAGHGTPVVLVVHDPGLGVARARAAVTGGRQGFAHRMEEAEWRGYWQRTLSCIDVAITFTDGDAALLRSELPGLEVQTIPLGIDIPPAAASPTGVGAPSVLFVGGYGHPPNEDAALRLIGDIMPRVRHLWPGLPLTLVGIDPTPAMHAAASPIDTITGRVETVAPYVDAATLMALPIRLGGGMRVKLLEAMAAGKAIVASPLAAAGLEVEDGEQLMLADDDAGFAEAISGLLGDAGRRARLAGRARAWAQDNLGWESRVRRYEELYRRLESRSASVTSS